MDIHAPDKPVHSFKDFAIHIAIVTIGILIALSLEGVEEFVHDRTLVRETRENFRAELENDLDHDQREYLRIRASDTLLKQLVKDLPDLQRNHPDQIRARVDAIQNPGYVFTQTSWQAALSSGALAHMSTEELLRDAGAFYDLVLYTQLQSRAGVAEDKAHAFFDSHPTLTPADLSEGAERILMFSRQQSSLVYYEVQIHEDLAKALGKPQDRPYNP